MLTNYWYAILSSGEVRKGKLTGVTRLGMKLALWRDGAGQVCCIADRCRGVVFTGREYIGNKRPGGD